MAPPSTRRLLTRQIRKISLVVDGKQLCESEVPYTTRSLQYEADRTAHAEAVIADVEEQIGEKGTCRQYSLMNTDKRKFQSIRLILGVVYGQPLEDGAPVHAAWVANSETIAESDGRQVELNLTTKKLGRGKAKKSEWIGDKKKV